MIIRDDIEQYSPEWWALRLGKPSGSKASSLSTSKGLPSESLIPYAKFLAGNLFVGKEEESYKSESMKRGTALEDIPRNSYSLIYNTEVKQVGLITDDAEQYLVSPDGLVNKNGMIEIKCPERKGFIDMMIYYKKHKKLPSSYICQPQMQLKTAEREWCDSVFYHPDFELFVHRQYVDENINNMLTQQLSKVIYERDIILKTLKEF